MIEGLLGPYRIDRELGSGGMGTVYRAAGPEGTVAVKIVHPHLLESAGFFKRFLREAELGRKVRHPNVVRTLDADAIGGHHYLVMEYVEGRSLRALLSDLGTVPESLLRELARQIAAGLAAIHAAGIVHRDLKLDRVVDYSDDLQLSNAQMTQIAAIRKNARQQYYQYIVQMRGLADQLDQILLQDDPDAGQAYAVIDQRTALMNQIERLAVDTAVAGAAVLTAQQKTRLTQIYNNEEAIFDSTPYFSFT